MRKLFLLLSSLMLSLSCSVIALAGDYDNPVVTPPPDVPSSAVPEPATFVLLGTGFALLLWWHARHPR